MSVPKVHGAQDGVNPLQTSESMAQKFAGTFRRLAHRSVGHFPTREAPEELAALLIEHFN
jgi:pimeloyl-ACP methyl ester carboxylesterase